MVTWLKTKEALEYLNKNGRSLSKTGLKFLGISKGFIRKYKDGYHWEYLKSGLDSLIGDILIPDGMISVNDFYNKYKDIINISKIYRFLLKGKIKIYKFGVRKNMYFNEEQFLIEYRKAEKKER